MRLLITVLFCLFLSPAFAESSAPTAPVTPGAELHHDPEKGWFFYRDPLKDKEKEPAAVGLSTAELPPDAPKPKPCLDVKGWTPECGFVDPGKDFDWQSKQRDALLQQMVMSPGESKGVEAFQRYNKWVVDKAVEAGNTWYWNMAQKPDLDPSVSQPISTFGLTLATKLASGTSKEIMKYIADNGGLLVYFTRNDCTYCHMMAPTVLRIAENTGIPTYDASLDGVCVEGFTGAHCLPAREALGPAQVLKVATVPALFLYIPKDTWIRVATGVSSETDIQGRIVNFFSAWRTAIAHGMKGSIDGQPPVDFNPNHLPELGAGNATGVPGAKIPTQSDIRKLLFN